MIPLRSAWQGHYETGSNSSTRRFVPPCQCSRRKLRLVRNSRSSPASLWLGHHARDAGGSRRHGNMAGVGNFVLGNLPNLICQQRDDGESFAGEGHEFDRAAFATFVNEHDRADVVLGQAMLRQVGRQYHAVEFFDHNQISNGYAVANVAVSAFLAINQMTRTSGARPSGAVS